MNQFQLVLKDREVKVMTDFPLTEENSAAYTADLKAHIKRVESGVRAVKFKAEYFYEGARK